MSRYFITGIGTGVGKTLVAAALAHQLSQADRDVRAYKPVVSGFDPHDVAISDTAVLCDVMVGNVELEAISPWQFEAPLSPHLAAEKEGREIDFDALVEWCQNRQSSLQLMEGVGGIMVPLNREKLVLDWMKALGWPVILVASSYLGAINHSLLTINAIKEAGLRLQGIVVCEAEESAGLEETCDAIRTFYSTDISILSIPRIMNTDTPWKECPSLLSLIS